jgi:hypothetical protein
METCAVTEPKLLVAVSWYTVEAAGRTTADVVPVTVPTPLSTVIEVALETFQVSVPDCPATIEFGATPNETMVGTGAAWVVACTPADVADELPTAS